MCHIALMLPLLALPVLWMWPLTVSGPVYVVIAVVSAAIYWYAVLAMRRPVGTGAEAMIGATGKVLESRGKSLVVQIGGEIWNARSAAALREGDRVEVIAVERLVITVKGLRGPAVAAHEMRSPRPDDRIAGA
jgi:membrane protein implicated in regulation of membrane protease activity